MLVRLLIERLAGWQETCKQVSVVNLPTFAGLAPAASLETRSILSMLYQGSCAQGVSNGNATAQNETNSSLIGSALSWDLQRQMHAELSSIETTPVETPASPAGSLGVLMSTDAYRFESARSGLGCIASNTANSAVMPPSAAPTKDTTSQITLPSSPAMALSILDMQPAANATGTRLEAFAGEAAPQADLRPSQVAEHIPESTGEPIASSPQAPNRNISSWVSFSPSIPRGDAQGPASNQSASPLSGTYPQQQTLDLLPSRGSPSGSLPTGHQEVDTTISRGPMASASTAGSGSPPPSIDAAAANLAVSARASQAASVPPALAVLGEPVTPSATQKVKRNVPALSDGQVFLMDRTHPPIESGAPVGDQASEFQTTTVKMSNELGPNATSAAGPLASSATTPVLPSTAVGSWTRLRTGDATPQSVVDHLSFEMSLRTKNPPAADDPVDPTEPGNNGPGAANLDLSSRTVASRPASLVTASDSATPALLDDTTDQATGRRSVDSSKDGLADVPAQSTASIGTLASSAQIVSTPLAPHATLKPEASSASISTGPPIVLPETKAPTPQGLVHDVQLRLQGEAGENISVRLSDRSGQVQISVRSSDQATATTLRQDLSTLSASLEKQGFKTDLSESPLQTAVHDAREPSNQQQSDQQGRQRSVPDWQDPPDKKRQSPSDQWADINEQETT